MNKVHQKQNTENRDKLHLFKQKILLRPIRAGNCKFDEKRVPNIVLTLKNRFQTFSQDYNFQLKTQIQVLQIFQNSAGAQAQLLRSLEKDYPESSLPTLSSVRSS